MAAFVAKQLVGNKIGAVKGQLGSVAGGGDKEEKEEDPEDAEARAEQEELQREAEAKRTEKYRKIEEERETMRQGIRDKYGIKKKEPPGDPMVQLDDPGRIGRKKKTPAELAAEAEKEEDEPIVIGNVNVSELTNKVSDLPGQLTAKVGDKCTVQ